MESFSAEQRISRASFGQFMGAISQQPASCQSPATTEGSGQPHGDNGEHV